MTKFAQNWWQSLSPFVIVDQHAVTIVALSPNMCDAFDDPRVRCRSALNATSDASNTILYNSKRYLQNIARKQSEWIRELASIPDGAMVLFSDADIVFLADPFAHAL